MTAIRSKPRKKNSNSSSSEQTEPFGGETANPAIAPIYRGEDEFSGASVVADIEADDIEVLEAEEAEETLPAVEDLAPEIEEALENAAGGEVVSSDLESEPQVTASVDDGAPAVQTAVVRDPRQSFHASCFAPYAAAAWRKSLWSGAAGRRSICRLGSR